MNKLRSALVALVVLLSLCFPALYACAADAVVFTDPVLEVLIRKQMGQMEGDITVAQAEQVKQLKLSRDVKEDPAVKDITSLKYFKNLAELNLYGNELSDLTALEGLANLQYLDLTENLVSDLSPLKKLPLVSLELSFNRIADISALAGLENLNRLSVDNNAISDFSPIAGLKKLEYLKVNQNATNDFSPLEALYGNLIEADFEFGKPYYPADEVIVFNDAALENAVRREMNMPDGPITAGDAATVEWLSLDADENAPDGEKIQDISALRYFTGLDGLSMNGNLIRDISPLQGLTGLHQLWILDSPLDDVSQLAGFTKLVKLGFAARMQNISFIGDMPELEELRADGLRELPAELPSLTRLQVFCSLGGELQDISLLSQCPNLFAVDLSWNLVEDLTPLKDLPLTELYLQGNPITDYSPIAELYPKLLGRNFEYVEKLQAENPDLVVALPDPVLEQRIREAIGKPQGDITAGDLANLDDLRLGNDWQPQIPDEIKITNLEGLQYCISLRSLALYFNGVTDLSPLAGLTSLAYLDLGGNEIADLGPLAGLANLQDLTLFGNRIEEIGPLSGLTALWSINLSNNSVSDLEPLAGLMSLGVLDVSSNPLSGVGPLSGLTGLGSLMLGGCGVEDISPLQNLTNLDRLELNDNYVSDLSALAGMDKLVILKLQNNPIADYAPIEAVFPQLQERDFEMGQQFDVSVPLKPEDPDAVVEIGDGALESVLRGATGVFDRPLTQKDLAGVGKFIVEGNTPEMLIFDISALRYCINLEGFLAYGSGISDLSPLRGLTKLRVLTITNAPLSDLSPLEGLETLKSLELKGCKIADISPLRSLVNLETLDLSQNRIADFSPLYAMQNLHMLLINFNATQDPGELKDFIPYLTEKDFDATQPLELNQWEDPLEPENPDAVVVFADPLFERLVHEQAGFPYGPITAAQAAQVERLDFNLDWQENIPEDTRIQDITGIEYFINLKILSLNFHAVGDIGMVSKLTRLEELDIGANGLSDLSVLAGLTQLRRLVAFGNGIEDISPLAGLTKLETLQLEHNRITDISPLAGMTELRMLWLTDNPITDYSPIEDIVPNLTDKDF